MFTDWTMIDPKYFYMRGILYGFVLATILWKVILPKIIKWRKQFNVLRRIKMSEKNIKIKESLQEFLSEIEADLNHRHETIMTSSCQEVAIRDIKYAITCIEEREKVPEELPEKEVIEKWENVPEKSWVEYHKNVQYKLGKNHMLNDITPIFNKLKARCEVAEKFIVSNKLQAKIRELEDKQRETLGNYNKSIAVVLDLKARCENLTYENKSLRRDCERFSNHDREASLEATRRAVKIKELEASRPEVSERKIADVLKEWEIHDELGFRYKLARAIKKTLNVSEMG